MRANDVVSDAPNDFVVRRAFRVGRVSRANVNEAYPEFSYSKSGYVLRQSLEQWPRVLVRDGHSIIAATRASCPAVAGEADLMQALDQGLFAMRFTGFRPDELPARQIRWNQSAPGRSGVLMAITRALAHQSGVDIRYVGMREGESARWRKVYPRSLEQMGLQWRLIAQCLETQDYPVRTFVLPRILDAAVMAERLPSDLTVREADLETEALRVSFDPRLTRDQQAALASEFGLVDGRLHIAKRSRWEFERQYGHVAPSEFVIWPPVQDLEDE